MTNREAIEIISRPFSMQEVPKEILDAHRLAISALEKQEQTNAQSVNSMRTSRPNALESLNILEQAKDDKGCVPMSLVRQAFRNIQEQDRWHSVAKEGNPKESGAYNCTCSDGTPVRRVTTIKYNKGINEWAMTGRRTFWKVLAWSPLPEPYTEEES